MVEENTKNLTQDEKPGLILAGARDLKVRVIAVEYRQTSLEPKINERLHDVDLLEQRPS